VITVILFFEVILSYYDHDIAYNCPYLGYESIYYSIMIYATNALNNRIQPHGRYS